jgi:hypothetical protein
MRRRNSSPFAYRNTVTFIALGAITAMVAFFFYFQSGPQSISLIKLNSCGAKAHLRGAREANEEQWVYDIYLDQRSLSAKYATRNPLDKIHSRALKLARIEDYACDNGQFTMTEVASSDHVDCTYYGKIIGEEISGAFYCPISVGSPIGEFHFDFQAR